MSTEAKRGFWAWAQVTEFANARRAQEASAASITHQYTLGMADTAWAFQNQSQYLEDRVCDLSVVWHLQRGFQMLPTASRALETRLDQLPNAPAPQLPRPAAEAIRGRSGQADPVDAVPSSVGAPRTEALLEWPPHVTQ